MVTDHAGAGFQALAWGYVLVRFAHAAIHLGPNKLRLRIRAYFTSWLVLVALWTWLAVAVAVTR
jgi:hypothetical protein